MCVCVSKAEVRGVVHTRIVKHAQNVLLSKQSGICTRNESLLSLAQSHQTSLKFWDTLLISSRQWKTIWRGVEVILCTNYFPGVLIKVNISKQMYSYPCLFAFLSTVPSPFSSSLPSAVFTPIAPFPFWTFLITNQDFFSSSTSVDQGCSPSKFSVICWLTCIFFLSLLAPVSAFISDRVSPGFPPTVSQIQTNLRHFSKTKCQIGSLMLQTLI